MFIQTETTSDPARLKFYPGRAVLESGAADFPDADAAKRSPLAQRLFRIESVKGVSLGSDFITVTKADDGDWQLLKPAILGVIMEHFISNQPVVVEAHREETTDGDGEDSEVVTEIKELIETRILSAVAQDGGDVIFRGYEDGIVLLEMLGSALGMKSGIENMLRHYIPEVVEVRSYEEHVRLQKPELKTPEALAVSKLLDEQINPAVAAHGGHISLIDLKGDTAYIRLEGGCQGCGMADVTLKQGVETAIKQAVPTITTVLDVTDHAGGNNPYFQPAKGGASPFP